MIDELGGTLRDWVDRQVRFAREHERRLNARSCVGPTSFALLRAADEAAALGVYLDDWDRALEEYCGRGGQPGTYASWARQLEATGLIDLLQTLRRRPAMFFGSLHVANLWAFTNGYAVAEADLESDSSDVARMRSFQGWMDRRYPFGSGGSWARTVRFLAMAVPERENDFFFEHLDLFLRGAPSDAPDPTTEALVANIQALSCFDAEQD